MEKYQVTALFGNKCEIVGDNEIDWGTALGLFRIYENTGRPVRIYNLSIEGGKIIKEANA